MARVRLFHQVMPDKTLRPPPDVSVTSELNF